MCGIAGIVNFNSEDRIDQRSLLNMRDAMVHRGPDGGGTWTSDCGRVGLGHRRLSIIDLDARADQPMTNQSADVVVTFNGEIYNHLTLRSELEIAGYEFRTDHSDTEVLVHGYSEWGGTGLLQRLQGDFAFAIWDAKRRSVFLARDRIGVKPLYFSFQDETLLFGSEIKAIVAHPAVKPDIEPIAMYHYLSFMTTPPPMTMFAGIYKLPPGFWLQIDLEGGITAERYWDAVPGQSGLSDELAGMDWPARESLYVEEIRRRLTESVEKRMMSDVPFGVFLSGGIDSSTNVALMSRFTDSPLNTFSIGFKDYTHLNELEYANAVAKEFATNHHEILIDDKDMMGYLSDLIHSQDEPIADWVCVPLYFVTKLTRDNDVTVVQVGEGSDEQFCGYGTYMAYLELYRKYWQPFRKFLPNILQKGFARTAGWMADKRPSLEVYADIIDRAARDREHFWSGATVFWDTAKRKLVKEAAIGARDIHPKMQETGLLPDSYLEVDSFNVIKSYKDHLAAVAESGDVLSRMTYNEFQLRLPELLLMRVDKITMSESLEARVPFLDHELVELSLDIPMQDKIHGGVPKYLLKKAVEGIIPDEIIYRKKMGFGAPMAQWLRGEFGDQAESAIFKSSILDRGMFDEEYIARLFADHRSGRADNGVYIWTLYNLFAWYDYWVAGSPRAPQGDIKIPEPLADQDAHQSAVSV